MRAQEMAQTAVRTSTVKQWLTEGLHVFMLLYTPENKDAISSFEETIIESKNAREVLTLTKMSTQELFFSFSQQNSIFFKVVMCPALRD